MLVYGHVYSLLRTDDTLLILPSQVDRPMYMDNTEYYVLE